MTEPLDAASAQSPVRIDPDAERRVRVARYGLVAPLGAGGMGTVHRAHDPELDRAIAIKLVNPERGREPPARATARLIREARAMAAVHHENVLPIYDFGVTDDEGDVFIAMELVEGCDLSQWLCDREQSTAEILRVFEAAGRGLAAAHAAGLVHRDFKPSNVLIGDDGRVRVCDFGLAWRPGDGHTDAGPSTLSAAHDDVISGGAAEEVDQERLTETGTVLGTPSYMAPEQRTGDPLDQRTDQFALCVALWEALYGAHPFGGQPSRRARRMLIGELEPLPPSRGEPPALRRALVRGLASDPGDRFDTLAPLLSAMRPRSGARWRWVAAVGALVVAGGFAMPSPAPAERADAEEVTEVEVAPSDGSAPVSSTTRESLDRIEALRDAGKFSEAIALATQLLDDAPDDATRAAASLQRGLAHSRAGDHDAAAQDLEAAYLVAHPAGWPKTAARAAVALVKTHGVRAQRYPVGREWAEHAESALQRAESEPRLWSRLAKARGELEQRAGRHDLAIAHFEHALGILDDAGIRVDPEVGHTYLGLCQTYTNQRRLEEAHLVCDRAIDIFSASLGARHPTTAVAMSAKAVAFMWAARNAEARDLLARAIEYQEEGRGTEDQELSAMLNNYSAALSGVGEHQAAVDAARRVVELRSKAHGESHPATAMALASLAGALIGAERRVEAIDRLQRAVSVLESMEESNPRLPYMQSGLGMIYAAEGQHEEAMRYHQRAAEGVAALHGADSARLAMILSRTLYDARDAAVRADLVARLRKIAVRPDVPDVDAKIAWAAVAGALRQRGDVEGADAARAQAMARCKASGADPAACLHDVNVGDPPAEADG